MKQLTLVSCLAVITLGVTACGSDSRVESAAGVATDNPSNTQILWVAAQKAPCSGVAPMQCMLIQKAVGNEPPQPNHWELFYDEIQGFNWQAGQRSKIKVRSVRLSANNVPADASSIRYELLKVISTTASKSKTL